MKSDAILPENSFTISDQLKSFAGSLGAYINEYEQIFIDISKTLPDIEKQIENNVLEARELMDFIFSNDTSKYAYGVKHELGQFHNHLNFALMTLKESEKLDTIIFSDIKKSIEISNSAIKKIKDIYNISENLKVFAINSIIYAQKAGVRGKGYQIISGEFIKLSEKIAGGTEQISKLGGEMNDQIATLLDLISKNEDFTHNHIEAISVDSRMLLDKVNNSIENLTTILNDLLNRIESVKAPTYEIMIELQKQDIIQQQLYHIMDAMNDILLIIDKNSGLFNSSLTDSYDNEKKDEYKSLYTVLNFLVITTKRQMTRISDEFIEMLNVLEARFSVMRTAIIDINQDKDYFSQLVIPREGSDQTASISHLIFQVPKETIEKIIKNLKISEGQKKNIIDHFAEIKNKIQSEKDIARLFVPFIEKINYLLMLARAEKARHNLDISDQRETKGDGFYNMAFSKLSEINDDMNHSHIIVCQNLEDSIITFNSQKSNYNEIEEKLNKSVAILELTEKLFKENYESVMNIANTLFEDINQYISLFDRLRILHKEITREIDICSDIQTKVEQQLKLLGGAIPLDKCLFKDMSLQQIVDRCTVDHERTTLREEFPELEIEESTGSNITLF